MKKALGIITILLFTFTLLHAQVRIKMRKENGIYTTPCKVNGLQLRFIFDTGASNVSISLSEAIFMLKNGYLADTDLHGSTYSQIANGDIIENTSINIRELEIGGIKLSNVSAIIVHELSAPLLLGQSAIQKLGGIQIIGDELIILNVKSNSSDLDVQDCKSAFFLCDEAFDYYDRKLYTLAAHTFQKAYDKCWKAVTCEDMFFFAYSYYYILDYKSAIKYFQIVEQCEKSQERLFFIKYGLAQSYTEIENYGMAILSIEKAMSTSQTKTELFLGYSLLSKCYLKQNNYYLAIEKLNEGINRYLSTIHSSQFQVRKGNVIDASLGEMYQNLSLCYRNIDSFKDANNSIVMAALCKYEPALEICEILKIDYNKYFEMK